MRNLTPEQIAEAEQRMSEAKSRYDEPWWDSDDPRTLFWGQINEPCLLIEFSKFHEAAEKALDRPVWSHEFAFKDLLIDEFKGKIPPATFADIFGKIPSDKEIIVIAAH